MTERIPYDHLDPGIRATVRLCAELGHRPTDSGDGVSKPDAGRVFDFPHVCMTSSDPVHEADLLRIQLQARGIDCVEQGPDPGPWIQATWCPVSRVGIIMLGGLSDADLP